jgi:hypothetical protein
MWSIDSLTNVELKQMLCVGSINDSVTDPANVFFLFRKYLRWRTLAAIVKMSADARIDCEGHNSRAPPSSSQSDVAGRRSCSLLAWLV